MANTLLKFIFTSIIIIATISATPYLSPESQLPTQLPTQLPPPPIYNISTLLNTLGIHDISVFATTTSSFPITIFAPVNTSLKSCPCCSLPLLLLEHTVPNLYTFRLLKSLPFGTKVQTLASSNSTILCLTLTKSKPINSTDDPTLFIGGVEITQPDLFNDGHVIVHGIDGYVTHLSPYSCHIEKMTSLSFPSLPTRPSSAIMRDYIYDAVTRLRYHDYTVISLLIQENVEMLLKLDRLTVFAVDDSGVFGDGHMFVSNMRYHIVVNSRLTGVEMMQLEVGRELKTMVDGERLVVTVAGGGGLLMPMRINNVKVVRMDVVVNERVVVHGVAGPFPRVHRGDMGFWSEQNDGSAVDLGPTATWDY